MLKLLLDANLSPETAQFLRKEFAFDVKSVLEEKLGRILDEQVVKIAKKEKRVIVTFDLDFGQTYHFREANKVGVIVLRLRDQTIENVNKRLKSFLLDNKDLDELKTALVIIDKFRYRFYSKE